MPTPRMSLSRRYNAMQRHHGADAPETLEAERDLRALQLQEYIREKIAATPPLTDAQLERVRALLPATADGAEHE